MNLALALLAWPAASVVTCATWVLTAGTRHNAGAAANVRGQLAAMGAACPDDDDGLMDVARAVVVDAAEIARQQQTTARIDNAAEGWLRDYPVLAEVWLHLEVDA